MELDDLVDRYKSSTTKTRLLIVIAIAILPSLYVWMEEGDRIAIDLENISQQENIEESKLRKARDKVARLPELLNKLSLIEEELKRAKNFLPDELEIDRILSILGSLEVRYDVQIIKLTLGKEVSPKNDIDYQEVPIALELKGRFKQIMQFYDNLVHLTNLTHLRSVELQRKDENDKEEPFVTSRSQLILFKGQ